MFRRRPVAPALEAGMITMLVSVSIVGKVWREWAETILAFSGLRKTVMAFQNRLSLRRYERRVGFQ